LSPTAATTPRGVPNPEPAVEEKALEPPPTLDLARQLWRRSVPAAGTLVETYLHSRRLKLPDDAPIRFHPKAWRNAANGPHGPAMVALMITPLADPETGRPRARGVHVTYLAPDGSGKADGPSQKIMLGNVGLIRLMPDEDVHAGLGIAEGIETALSVMQGFDWRPVWAATSAGAIRTLSVLPGIEALTIFADPDEAGLKAAKQCAVRWQEAGREVRISLPPIAGDFNDLIQHKEPRG
jgi:hypothetical protein